LATLHKNVEFVKLFGDSIVIPLFLWGVDTFLGFAQKSTGKWLATTCHSAKEISENLRNVPMNRKKDIKIKRE
jgi:hypothetical protein